ncbi:hypothetical protein FIBSPDRAFT_868886 [Athelia psychrophila]|uniref:Uncharacterized protein n=1 Tax=Athelia psychrophila TaxID=1759441 RepID=A0A166CPQ4_9AGAM|nr:hypothetical protein FIBSPDRAFT_868886 [Fibularhizoctonia sp. CBS 109695]
MWYTTDSRFSSARSLARARHPVILALILVYLSYICRLSNTAPYTPSFYDSLLKARTQHHAHVRSICSCRRCCVQL